MIGRMAFIARLSTTFHIEVAHRMPAFPETHRNGRLHGHSYSGEIVIEGPVDAKSGFVMGHDQLFEVVQGVTRRLDHYYLNDIPGLENPSGENICYWMWQQLRPQLPGLKEIALHRESCGISISYRGEEIA